MKCFIGLAVVLCATCISSRAAAVAAAVTSASPFTLDGSLIDTPGVTSFPLVVDDTVATPNGPAVLFFQDGSSVKLGTHSSVRITGVPAKPKVVLLSGTLDYKLVLGSSLSVTSLDLERRQAQPAPAARSMPVHAQSPERAMLATLDTPATPPPSQTAKIVVPREPTGYWLANQKFLVPATAGASGLATALLRLPPVSRHF